MQRRRGGRVQGPGPRGRVHRVPPEDARALSRGAAVLAHAACGAATAVGSVGRWRPWWRQDLVTVHFSFWPLRAPRDWGARLYLAGALSRGGCLREARFGT